MNSDSSLTNLDYLPIFPENYTDATDFVVKLLSFDDNHGNEVTQLYDNGKKGIKLGSDQFYRFNLCENIPKFKIMNSDIHPSDSNKSSNENEDMHHTKNNDLNLVKKIGEFMQAKMEVHTLQEKVELCEKEKADLLLKAEMLQAQNFQFTHLKKNHNEFQSNVSELQKDISNQLKVQQTMRMEVEGYKKQLSGKNKTMKKLETCNRKLRNMVMQFIRKLEDADLLTMKEKVIIKKFKDGNLENVSDFEDEEKNDSSMLNSNTLTVNKQNKHCVINESNNPGCYSCNVSECERLLSMNSSKKLAFSCQREEFDAGPLNCMHQPNLNAGYSNHSDLNNDSFSSSTRAPYKFSAKRCRNGTVKLNFQIEDPISMRVNPNNWEVSCILGPHLRRSDFTPQPKLIPVNVNPYVKGHSSFMVSDDAEPIVREILKVNDRSSSKLTDQKSSERKSHQESFVPFKEQSVFKPSVIYSDLPDYSNSPDNTYKKMKIKKDSENTAQCQQFENAIDDCRSVSLKTLSQDKKCVDLYSQDFLLQLNNSIFEAESKELDDRTNFTVKSPVVYSPKTGNRDISGKMLNNTLTDGKCSGYCSSTNKYEKNRNPEYFSKLRSSMYPLAEKSNKCLQKDGCFYNKSFISTVASHPIKDSTSSVSSYKKMGKSISLQENSNHDKGVSNYETNTSGSFPASCAVSSSIDPSVYNSLEPLVSDVRSIVDKIIDHASASVEGEMETEYSPRRCRKRRNVKVNSSHQINKKKGKKGLQNISGNMVKEYDILISDAQKISKETLKVDPDIKLSHRPISEVENAKEIIASSENNIPSKTPMIEKRKNGVKKPKKTADETEFSHIEVAFKAIEKIKPTAEDLELYVEKLVADLSDASISQSSQNLIFHLVKYLHNTKKKPMYSYFISNNPDTLLPISERYIVKILLTVDTKTNPHLSDLLSSTIKTMYHLILGKMQYHIYGLSSLCRVMTALCKELNNPSTPRHLCCDLLKYNHKFGPFLIASIVGVYKEAFEVLPNTPDEVKIFISALSRGVQRKPETLTDALWNHSCKVLSKYLTFKDANISKEISYIKKTIEEKCISGLKEDEKLLTGPLVIYARVKGWNWAQKHLLEGYVQPNLLLYSSKKNGERGVSFFADLCADICYGCPDEDLSQSWLIDFLFTPCEREFVQFCAGAALIKLILLRKELFPDKIKEWVSCNYEDPRVIAICNLHFKLRLMEDHDLDFASDIF